MALMLRPVGLLLGGGVLLAIHLLFYVRHLGHFHFRHPRPAAI